MDWILTRRERVIPPVGFAQERFEVVGGAANDYDRRGHQRPHQKCNPDEAAEQPQPLQEISVRDFDRFCRAHAKDDWYPAEEGKREKRKELSWYFVETELYVLCHVYSKILSSVSCWHTRKRQFSRIRHIFTFAWSIWGLLQLKLLSYDFFRFSNCKNCLRTTYTNLNYN